MNNDNNKQDELYSTEKRELEQHVRELVREKQEYQKRLFGEILDILLEKQSLQNQQATRHENMTTGTKYMTVREITEKVLDRHGVI